MADGSANGTAVQTEAKRGRRHSEEAFDSELEWFRVMGDSAMGERGTLAGVVAQLEHGGPFTGVPNTDLYDEQQLGWGKTTLGLVEKHRWLSDAWSRLPGEQCFRLDLWYSAPPAAFRSDEGFGARDRCPSVEEIQKAGAIESQKPTFFHVRKGTEARLGRAAALAIWLAEKPGDLLVACQDPNKGKNGRIITRALKLATETAVEDHKAWRVEKEAARHPRTSGERRAILPEFEPTEAEQS